MIRILEGPIRDVEKLANQLEADGWYPIGPAVPNGVQHNTGAVRAMLTLERGSPPSSGKQPPTEKDWTRFAYELNQAGCCDE